MTRSRHRSRVALKEPSNVDAFCIYVRSILQGVEGNSWFPDPVPALPVIKSALTTLERLSVEATGGPRGSREKRDAERDVLVIHLHLLRAYVEWVAALNPENTASIIESSRFNIAVKVIPEKPPFRVKSGRISGSVVIILRAVAKSADYEFQYSADGGETWVTAAHKLQAKTTIPDLQPGKTYLFRARPSTRRGTGDWTRPFAFMVR